MFRECERQGFEIKDIEGEKIEKFYFYIGNSSLHQSRCVYDGEKVIDFAKFPQRYNFGPYKDILLTSSEQKSCKSDIV